MLASGEESIRSTIFDGIIQNSSLFNRTGFALKDGYQHVHRQYNELDSSDLNNWYNTDSSGPDKLRQYVADFAQNEFPEINKVIVNCFREHEKGVANR